MSSPEIRLALIVTRFFPRAFLAQKSESRDRLAPLMIRSEAQGAEAHKHHRPGRGSGEAIASWNGP